MIIALDYDGTYTADPDLWDQWIDLATKRGHTVICVTMRYPHEPVELRRNIEVIYTSRAAKASWLEANSPHKPKIWIDDNPFWIYQSSLPE